MVPAFATHLCVGTAWAWSAVADTITREAGFVAAASADWTLAESLQPMPLLFCFFGLTSATAGAWQARVGERKALSLAAACFGGGLIVGAAGIATHSLALLNLGYGVLAGAGVGLAYTPPIQALMQWFPDNKGTAMGTLIAGFGSGALAFVPCWNALTRHFAEPPRFLGAVGEVATTSRDGVLYATAQLGSGEAGGVAGNAAGGGAGGELVEAVQASAADLARLTLPDGLVLSEGFYAVGTGATGAAEALAVSGLACGAIMGAAAFAIKRPAPGWLPQGYSAADAAAAAVGTPSLEVAQVMRTNQFYKLGVIYACLTTGTYGLFSVAKGMMAEVFAGPMPALITAGFTSTYLMALSVGNLSGRFGMATLSDRIGCRSTFNLIVGGLLPLYLLCPPLVATVAESGSEGALYGFCGVTFVAVFLSCGVISTTPAYEASLFGTRNVGAVHGRMLLFNSVGAAAGPALFVGLRNRAEHEALGELLPHVDGARFEGLFGLAPTPEAAAQLVDAKTLTIAKLHALVPAEAAVANPAPYLYDSTMQAMAALVVVAGLTHYSIAPVDGALFAGDGEEEEEEEEGEDVRVVDVQAAASSKEA